jgi:3-hydroxyisobutyrate dehydrogenase-like beta-hydroxyacid dehydrogenase
MHRRFKMREQHFLRVKVMLRALTFGHKLAQYLDVTTVEVTVYNRTLTKAEALVAESAVLARDVSGACNGEAVFTMLANDEAVEDVVLSAGPRSPCSGGDPHLLEHD